MPENPIYDFLKANKLTDKDEATFLKEYSDSSKAKELYGFFQANNLTDKDFNGFYDTYLKKKETASPLGGKVGSSVGRLDVGAGITEIDDKGKPVGGALSRVSGITTPEQAKISRVNKAFGKIESFAGSREDFEEIYKQSPQEFDNLAKQVAPNVNKGEIDKFYTTEAAQKDAYVDRVFQSYNQQKTKAILEWARKERPVKDFLLEGTLNNNLSSFTGKQYQLPQSEAQVSEILSDLNNEKEKLKTELTTNWNLSEVQTKAKELSKIEAAIRQNLTYQVGRMALERLSQNNPNVTSKDIGKEIFRVLHPDEYDLYEKVGGDKPVSFTVGTQRDTPVEADALNEQMVKLGNEIKRMYGNETAIQDADIEEQTAKRKYTFHRQAQVKQKIAAILHERGLSPDKATEELKDRVVNKYLPDEDKEIWYNNNKIYNDVDLPSTGFAYSLKNAYYDTVKDAVGTVFGGLMPNRKKMRAAELLEGMSTSDVLGEDPQFKARLSQLKEKEKTQQLNDQEKQEKEQLEQFTDLRSKKQKIFDMAGSGVGQILGLGSISAFTGGLSSARTGLGALKSLVAPSGGRGGIMAASYLMSHENNAKEALRMFPNEKDALKRFFSTEFNTAIDMAVEQIFPEEQFLSGIAKKEVSKLITNLTAKNIASTLNDNAFKQLAKNIVGRSKKLLATPLQETAEEEIALSLKKTFEGIIAPDKSDGLALKDVVETGEQAFWGSVLLGAPKGVLGYTNNKVPLTALWDAASSQDGYTKTKMTIERLKRDGELTEAEAKDRLDNLELGRNEYLNNPILSGDMGGLDAGQKQNYFARILNEAILKKQADAVTDPNLKKQYEQQIKESEAIREKIYKGEIKVTPENEELTKKEFEKREKEQQRKTAIGLQDKIDDIERRRQEELNQQTDAGYSIIALDYLFTGGRDVIQSTDYLLQALVGGFTSAAKEINNIRNKYADKLGNIKDDINSDIYNQMMSEIRNVINKNYNNSKANEIFDKILKNATGFTSREGNQVSTELDKLNEQNEAEINAKYDAELDALEQTTIDQDRVLGDEETVVSQSDEELLTTLQELAQEGVKNQDLQFFVDQAANAPNQFIETYGEQVTQELLDKATTEQIQKGLEDARKFENNPNVSLLEKELERRGKTIADFVAPQAEASSGGVGLADKARTERREKYSDIINAKGSTFWNDIKLENAKIGDEFRYEEYKDGKWIKHKTKVKDIVDGGVIFENGQTQKNISSYMNITAEDMWFAKNIPEAASGGVGDVLKDVESTAKALEEKMDLIQEDVDYEVPKDIIEYETINSSVNAKPSKAVIDNLREKVRKGESAFQDLAGGVHNISSKDALSHAQKYLDLIPKPSELKKYLEEGARKRKEYYEEKIGKAQRNLIRSLTKFSNVFDGGNPNQIAEAYHKAKADGSNPELVKAVEDLLLPKEQPKADSGGVVDVEAKKAEINKRYDEEVSEYERKIKQAEEDIAAKKGGTYLPSKNKQKEAIADINDNRRLELEQLEKQSSQPEAGSGGVWGGSKIAKRIRDNIKDLPEKDLGDAEANKNWNDIRESRKRIKSMSDEELLKEVQKGMGGKLINQAIYESYFGMDITAKDIETELQFLKEQPKAETPTQESSTGLSRGDVENKNVPLVNEKFTTTPTEPVSSVELPKEASDILKKAILDEQNIYGKKESKGAIQDKEDAKSLIKNRTSNKFDIDSKERLAKDLGLPVTYFDDVSFKDWVDINPASSKYDNYEAQFNKLKDKYKSDIDAYAAYKDQSLSSNTPSQAQPKAGSGGVGEDVESKVDKMSDDEVKNAINNIGYSIIGRNLFYKKAQEIYHREVMSWKEIDALPKEQKLNVQKKFEKWTEKNKRKILKEALTEQSLKEKPKAETPTQETKPVSEPTTPPTTQAKELADKGVGKYEKKAREIADKIQKSELPDWLKADLPDGTKKAGASYDQLKKALADAVIEMGKLLDKGVEYSQAIKQAVKDLVSLQGEENRDTIEKGFEKYYTDQTQQEPPPPQTPKQEPKEVGGDMGGKKKAVLNRLYNAKNVPQSAKEGFEREGLTYKPKSQKEAAEIAKSILDEFGVDEAVELADSSSMFEGDVRTLIFAEALDRLQGEENAARWEEVAIAMDKFERSSGRAASAVNYFYKNNPYGVQLKEEADRKEAFDKWATSKKEKSWKEFFEEFKKDPEFNQYFKEQVYEELKKERAKSRQGRIKKVRDVFAKAKASVGGKGAVYSAIIPPKIITGALDVMEKLYEAGEAVAEVIQRGIDYINKEYGTSWDSEKFREEWEEKLKEPSKAPLTEEEFKKKVLDRFRNRLKGLSDKQRDEVVRRMFDKVVNAGALEYDDLRDIIADVLGYGKLTAEEGKRLQELVKKRNAVGEAAKKAQEERTDKALEEYRLSEIEAGKAARELQELLWNKPDIIKRLTSIMQLSTLGIPSLINNPVYNFFNQLGVRFPVGLINSTIDKVGQFVANKMGKNYVREYNIFDGQAEFWAKLGVGSKEAVQQLFTGLNRQDYIQKEYYGQQIRPMRAIRDLIRWKAGEKKLTKAQVIDKALQASVGIPAEVVARFLNIGDKPQRFAAEGSQAAAFAKALGLKDIDRKLFIEFPKEEAYRAYKAQGLSDEAAATKSEYIKEAIIKEGQRSTFQQDNLLNDAITRFFGAFGGKDSGTANLVKTLTVSPYIKIPTNAFWSYYNLVNPEVAILQSFYHAGRAKMSSNKGDEVAAKLQMREARYWLAHALTGMAMRGLVVFLVQAGIFVAGNTGDESKKEREAESFFEQPGTLNISKLWALMRGEDPKKVKNGVLVSNRWFGQFGTLGNSIMRKWEDMTPEQRENQQQFWNIAFGGMELEALKEMENGIFANTSSLLDVVNTGDFSRYGLNTINMFTNILQPASIAQINRASLNEVPQAKGDTFLEKLNQNFAQRSSLYRKAFDVQLQKKRSIWGEPISKGGNILSRMFGITKIDEKKEGRPMYEDYMRTNDSGFLPPAVLQTMGKQKLNQEQYNKLQDYIGQSRKAIALPYIDDKAVIPVIGKKYSELNDKDGKPNDELRKAVLQYLYELGRDNGVAKFYQDYPEFKKPEKSVEEQVQESLLQSALELIKLQNR